MTWEDDLRRALRTKQPAPDFTERVLARVPTRRRPHWAWAAVAASLFTLVSGAGWREYQGLKAKRNLMTALDIAASKLDQARDRVLNERTKHD